MSTSDVDNGPRRLFSSYRILRGNGVTENTLDYRSMAVRQDTDLGKEQAVQCAWCDAVFARKRKEVARALRNGRACYCSRSCFTRAKNAQGKSKADVKSFYASIPEKRIRDMPEYSTWQAMVGRCSDLSRPNYGAVGVKVCAEWQAPHGFLAFIKHVGRKPSPKHSLDRIDPKDGYKPGNVRWASSKEQNRNKRQTPYLVIDNNPIPLVEVAERLGLARSTLYNRINVLGWTTERALTEPPRVKRPNGCR